jgi:hypothetical protein
MFGWIEERNPTITGYSINKKIGIDNKTISFSFEIVAQVSNLALWR